MCADAPDTSGQQAAAVATSNLSKEQFDWVRSEYDKAAPERAAASERANKVADSQIQTQDLNNRIAQESYDNYKGTFQPIEKGLAADAQAYDTPERRAAAAAAAGASVEQQISAQRDASARALQRAGVDPSGGKSAAMAGMLDINAAKVKAGAANSAERTVEQQGVARRMDVASLGRGIASSQATNSQIATSAGSAAAANGLIPTQVNQAGVGMVNSAYTNAIGAQGQVANIYGGIAGQNAAAANANAGALGGIGQGVGTIAAIAF